MKSKFEKILEWALRQRFCALVYTALAGIALTAIVASAVYCVSGAPITEPGRFFASLYVIMLSLPTLTMLWFFRTHDTREQIKKTEESTNTNILLSAQQMLSETRGKVAGLAILWSLREKNLHTSVIDAITCYADLSDVNLSFWTLCGLVFNNAKFCDAQFWGTNLSGVDLGNADLSGADLLRANLRNARLSLANLTNARLVEAQLQNANLRQAKLAGALLDKSDLCGADLKLATVYEMRDDGSTLRASFVGARYSDGSDGTKKTEFPADFNPEEHGMKKKHSGKQKR